MERLLEKLGRDLDSHKGENGKVGIMAGSRDFTGAPALAAKAVMRTGSDLTRILTSESARYVVAGFSENFIVDSFPSSYFDERALERAGELEEWADSLVIGPGMGDVDDEALRKFVSSAEKPLVIDADGIEPALDADISGAVFTPHRGEVGVIEERFGSVEDFVEETSALVLVKGPTDRLYTPEDVFENDTGDPSMTVGGTGDVLAGIIASLIARGLELEDAARLGAWINGKAGEKAAAEYGRGALATDIVEVIPEFLD